MSFDSACKRWSLSRLWSRFVSTTSELYLSAARIPIPHQPEADDETVVDEKEDTPVQNATSPPATKTAQTSGLQSATWLPAGPNELLFEIEYRLQALGSLAAAIGREVAKAVSQTLFHAGL